VALITLIVTAGFNVWGKGKMRLYSLLIGMVAGYAVSLATGILTLDQARLILDSAFFQLPEMGKFGMSFSAAMLVPFLVAALSSALKTMGDLTTCFICTSSIRGGRSSSRLWSFDTKCLGAKIV